MLHKSFSHLLAVDIKLFLIFPVVSGAAVTDPGHFTELALELDFGYLSQKMSTPFKRWLERSRKRWTGGIPSPS